MTRRDALLRLKSRLIERRDALRKALVEDMSRLREASEVVGYGDRVDAAADSANDEICSRLAEIESRELARIEQALQRLVEGGYGRCACCCGRIPASRLNALPYTTYCIRCQRRDERRRRPEVATPCAERWASVDDESEMNGDGDPTAWSRRGEREFDLDQLVDTRQASAASTI